MSLGRLKSQTASTVALVVGATAFVGVSAAIFVDALKTLENQPKIVNFAKTDSTKTHTSETSREEALLDNPAVQAPLAREVTEKSEKSALPLPQEIRDEVVTSAAAATDSDAGKQKKVTASMRARVYHPKVIQIAAPQEVIDEFEEELDFQAITANLRQNFYVAVVGQWERKVAQKSPTSPNLPLNTQTATDALDGESEYSNDEETPITVSAAAPEVEDPSVPETEIYSAEEAGPKPFELEALTPRALEIEVPSRPLGSQSEISKAKKVTDSIKTTHALSTQGESIQSMDTHPAKSEDYPLILPEETRGLAQTNIASEKITLPTAQAPKSKSKLRPRARLVEVNTQSAATQPAAKIVVNTQASAKVSAPVKPVPTVSTQTTTETQSAPSRDDSGLKRVARDASFCRNSDAPIFNSFNQAEEKLTVVQFSELTREDPKGLCSADQFYGWTVAKAPLHWNAIFWSNQRAESLSHNQALLLAATAQTQIQAGTSIIYGRVAAGYRVALSGRAESAVYLDARSQPVAETEDSSERYFAFINVAPGSQLLYFIENKMGQPGAVGVPSVSNAATYVDLRELNETKVSGTVLDAASAQDERRPIAGALVEVIGYDGVSAFTKDDGSFEVSKIWTISDIPTFLQVAAQERLSHRFRWSPTDSDLSASLYVFSNDQIRNYSDQLDGGISLDSGMMMGAVPGPIQRAPEGTLLYPGLRLLTSDENFHSEVYTLNARSELQVTKSLSLHETRMLYFQIPEGPVIPFLENKEQKLIWSELQFISPNVVNVIGPYLE